MLGIFLLVFLSGGCATYKTQYVKDTMITQGSDKEVSTTLFLAGGLGNNPDELLLDQLSMELQQEDESTILLLTGDNITQQSKGKNNIGGIQNLTNLIQNYKGKTFFIPGDYEWGEYKNDPLGDIERLFANNPNPHNEILSKRGCPLEQITLTDDLDLILIDSKWYLQNWDNRKNININCRDIKTRINFVEELGGMIRDARGKNLILAMHHPIFSNGEHAGNKGITAHMTPVPIVGSLAIGLEQLTGLNTKSMNSRRYRSLMVQVSSIAHRFDRVTVVSSHEKSLQLLRSKKVNQLISGAIGKTTRTKKGYGAISTMGGKLDYNGVFTSGQQGYAKLVYYTDGSSQVFFHAKDQANNPSVFEVEKAFPNKIPYELTSEVREPITVTSILNPEVTKKGKVHTTLWGKNNRSIYAIPITANNGLLDTLYGGLSVKKEGGGRQSNNLRLIDKEGKEYAMRGLKKVALKFMQFRIKGVAYDPESYENTAIVKFVNDFFTNSHPYMQLIIPEMTAAVGINHADPRLFYIPEQKSLGHLNSRYGNSLYFIEQRPSKKQKLYDGFNRIREYKDYPITDFKSTTNMLKKLRSNKKYSIDQKAYIRARIFDMLIGDWDRHQDNWRWAEYSQEDGKKVFVPIPRDRDGAFCSYKGLGIDVAKMFVPDARFWQTYGKKIKSIKWLNGSAFGLDNALLREFDLSVWENEARAIKAGITDEVLERAFDRLPLEIRERTREFYKPLILKRLDNLENYSVAYAKLQAKTVVLHATDKDDKIRITRKEDGTTLIQMFEKKEHKTGVPFFHKVYAPEYVNEIWIYGLNNNDLFEVKGSGKAKIMLRLIGGDGGENFIVDNRKKLKVYDYKHESNSFEGSTSPKSQFSEKYKVNTFHHEHFLKSHNAVFPSVGFGNDKGLFVGFSDIYTRNGFNGNPYRQQHTFLTNYYVDLSAVELSLQSDFASVLPDVNLDVDVYFTSQGYARNFYGFGNNTINQMDLLSVQYHQVETRQVSLFPGLRYKIFKLGPEFESFQVAKNVSRIGTKDNLNPAVFESQEYLGAKLAFTYKNVNNPGYPTKGFYCDFSGGWKINIEDNDNNFGYVDASIGIDQKLVRSENLVLSTKIAGRTNIGDNYYFYHGVGLGQNRGLRGFRNNRFTGKHAFSHSSDLKIRLLQMSTNFLPVTLGLYGGFDYGRVWLNNDNSSTWHHGQGGGIWIGAMNALTLKLGYFTSKDGPVLDIKLGFAL
ncbi:hypothetical protein N9933_02840 [bacterium]|nr:hypothetical protein [bacterium]